METTTAIALSRQMVLRRHMDVIANNIANMTATGFRAENLLAEEVPVDVGIGRNLTPPEAITAHLDVDVEEFDLQTRLTQPEYPAFIICCEADDGLYLLGSAPDGSEFVAVASVRRARDQERFRVAVRASLQWVPEVGSVGVDAAISIGDLRIVE